MRVASVRGINRDATWRGGQQLLPRAALEPCMTEDGPKNHCWRAEHSWTSDPERLKPRTADILSAPLAQEGTIVARHLLVGRKLYSQLISPNDSGLKVEGNLTGSGQIFTVVKASHEIEPNRLNFLSSKPMRSDSSPLFQRAEHAVFAWKRAKAR